MRIIRICRMTGRGAVFPFNAPIYYEINNIKDFKILQALFFINLK